ncbi:transcriptional regulator [Kaistia sp. 32K]|uniref:helix-turn-helix domain-containing protein n=1 Tax=Kaistia sp. 32K TaxID=2795690 RepID=UPI001914F43C|nr:helix-turn-helix domain-containing protein [Kaistia sp. 32K]BCP53694.1 transcriptional regulator [Kaistia sp. 32K]
MEFKGDDMLTSVATARNLALEAPGRRISPASGDARFAPAGIIGLMGITLHFERGSEIVAEEDPAEYIYQVLDGTVRICKLLCDGRRQIGAFVMPGGYFGMEARGTHCFAAEAITDVTVQMISRSAAYAAAGRDPEIARALWEVTAQNLDACQRHALLLGRKTALEKIGSFLSEMAERQGSDEEIELPMSRQDIADYLGLTIETVSRTMTQLEGAGTISLETSRHVLLRRPAELARLRHC